MSNPTGARCVVPSRVGVGEPFTVKLRLLGPVHPVPCSGNWCDRKPRLKGPFNLNVSRKIQFMDNTLETWTGTLQAKRDASLSGPDRVVFDGVDQGVFEGDIRPIKVVEGFCWNKPGFHFVQFTDPVSGLTFSSNPMFVTPAAPAERIYWGDPHWQTFFSDGIRCPEELYAFARDEGFLDFGAISDHMEAVTNRQWDYFQAVTNDYNEPGQFATLHGQEWTHHVAEHGAPGHRNIYYRGDGGPVLRCNDPDCNALKKLWQRLDAITADGTEAIAIPHHPANVVMGVDWDQGWNSRYEKAVEVYSVWGSSEVPGGVDNPYPILSLDGEMKGRHIVEALKRGFRMSFVGGGDIHDGRPGDDLHDESYPPRGHRIYNQGLTAAMTPTLTREGIFDAIRDGHTYATTKSRIYLDVVFEAGTLVVNAASEDGIDHVTLVRSGDNAGQLTPAEDRRIVQGDFAIDGLQADDFVYVRVITARKSMAWSSPIWGDAK